MKTKLVLAVSLLVIGTTILTGCGRENIACEKLAESECLGHQDVCSLCPEVSYSSFASCHSVEFCKNVPLSLEGDSVPFEEVSVFPVRDNAIEQYLLSEPDFAWQTEEGSQHACVFENLGSEDDLFPLSLWVYCREYRIQDDEIIELSGASGPALVDYPNELSYFNRNNFSHQSPRDGSLYAEDIKNIFSEEVQAKIFNHQDNISSLVERWKSKVRQDDLGWKRIISLLNSGEVEQVFQSHALDVSVTLKDGQTFSGREPRIDDIFDEVKKCGEPCKNIMLATE